MQLTLRLDMYTYKFLEEISEKKQLSIRAVIRDLIVKYLNKSGEQGSV
jgi:predicted DNA-binding ribbon-helix-helix protein